MKKLLLLLSLLLLVISLRAQRYGIISQELCWNTGSVDSSLTRYILVSSKAKEVLKLTYLNASGQKVDVSSGGSFSQGHCGCCGGTSSSTISSSTPARSGLTNDGDTLKLGGVVEENTTIAGMDQYDLAVTNWKELTLSASDSFKLITPNLINAAAQLGGVLQLNSATGRVEFTPYGFPTSAGANGQYPEYDSSGDSLKWVSPYITAIETDTSLRFSVNGSSISTISKKEIIVDSIAEVLNKFLPTDFRVISKGLDGKGEALYYISDTPIAGYATDTIAVTPTLNGKYAILQAYDGRKFKIKWFGARGETDVNDQAAFQRAIDFTTSLPEQGDIELQNGKIYEVVMPIRGAMEQPYTRYVLYGRTGMSFMAENPQGADKPIIYPKPPENFKTTGNLDGNLFLLDNSASHVDSLYFSGIHFWVPEDTMWLNDSVMNNIPTVFYDYDSPGSADSYGYVFEDCLVENFSNPQVSNQNAKIIGVVNRRCGFYNLGGPHTGFWGSPSNPGKPLKADHFTWVAPTDKDTVFINQYGNIDATGSVARWFDEGKIVHRAALTDYTFRSEYIDTFLYYRNDSLFLKNNSATVDSIVIWSQSVELADNHKYRYVETADLTFNPSDDVVVEDCDFYGGMGDGPDHWIYTSRSSDNFSYRNNKFVMSQSAPGVYDLEPRYGGGMHIKGGVYPRGDVSGNEMEDCPTTFLRLGVVDNLTIYNNFFKVTDAAPPTMSSLIDGASAHRKVMINKLFASNETEANPIVIGGGSVGIPTGSEANMYVSNSVIKGFAFPFALQYSNWFISDTDIISPDSTKSVIRGENQNGRQDRIIHFKNVSIEQKVASYYDPSRNQHILSGASEIDIDNFKELGNIGTELRIQGGQNVRITNNDIGLIRLGYDPGTIPSNGTVIVHNNPYSSVLYRNTGDHQDSLLLLSDYSFINANRTNTTFTINNATDAFTVHDTEKEVFVQSDGVPGRGISSITVRAIAPSGKIPFTLVNVGDSSITLNASGGNLSIGEEVILAKGEQMKLYHDVLTGNIYDYEDWKKTGSHLRIEKKVGFGTSGTLSEQVEINGNLGLFNSYYLKGKTSNGFYNNLLGLTGSNNLILSAPTLGATGNLVFQTASQNRLWIATDGDIGIGNISPNYKLDVTGDIHTSGDYYGITNPQGGTNTVQAALDSLNQHIEDLEAALLPTTQGTSATTAGPGTTLIITHNLGQAPTYISITPGGDIGDWYIDSVNSTTITLNYTSTATTTASSVNIYWQVE